MQIIIVICITHPMSESNRGSELGITPIQTGSSHGITPHGVTEGQPWFRFLWGSKT